MSTFKIIGVTSRLLCPEPLEYRVEKLLNLGVDRVIVREKDLCLEDYLKLSQKILSRCEYDNRISLHYYLKACEMLNHRFLHIPIHILKDNIEIKKNSDILGVSVHSAQEAVFAAENGADYVIAGHIFATDCKKGLEPRGLVFLKSICSAVNIPVYAIGGINRNNIDSVKSVGASGACLMSSLNS